ncbi:MAG: site-specific DNA-methyltransferase [Bacteroidia bacterium]|nr:site-specific DNA-methyltransferase [Bacteroidia bacterium]
MTLLDNSDKLKNLASLSTSIIFHGDTRDLLPKLPDNHYATCITSPPYWGKRDYGIKDQIGAEERLEDFIDNITSVFREVRAKLKPEGTLWLNIGDGYTSGNRTWRAEDKKNPARAMTYRPATPDGLKPKDLLGMPWRVALALQQDGWYLRSDIIWYKPNCQPESVKDRPTMAHEYLFLFSKEEKYYYDYEAIRESSKDGTGIRNKRTVWEVNTEPFPEAHFATFPTKLVEPCVLAASPPGGIVLDPFLGSGTVGLVSQQLGREFHGIEINPAYVQIAQRRLSHVQLQAF